MLNNHKQFVAWRRQVFVRNPHRNLNALYAGLKPRSGVYLIGCAEEIVYIGQSWDLTERPIDSLGRFYQAWLARSCIFGLLREHVENKRLIDGQS